MNTRKFILEKSEHTKKKQKKYNFYCIDVFKPDVSKSLGLC